MKRFSGCFLIDEKQPEIFTQSPYPTRVAMLTSIKIINKIEFNFSFINFIDGNSLF